MANNYPTTIDEIDSAFESYLGKDYDVTTKYNEKSGYTEINIKKAGSSGGTTIKCDPSNPESMRSALATFPGSNGGGMVDAHISEKGYVDTGHSSIQENLLGTKNALDTGVIDKCVSFNGGGAKSMECALDAFQEVFGSPIDTIVINSQSIGASTASIDPRAGSFLTYLANDERYNDTKIIGAFYDSKNNYEDFNNKAFMEASAKANVSVVCYPSKNFGLGGDGTYLRNTIKAIREYNSQGAKFYIAHVEGDSSLSQESHLTTIYYGIKHGNVNANLDGQIISEDINYEVTYYTKDANGNNVDIKLTTELLNYIEGNPQISDEEKCMYYTLKSRYDFIPKDKDGNSKISIEYTKALEGMQSIMDYVADHTYVDSFKMDSVIKDGWNPKINNFFSQAEPYLASTSVLDYKVKQSLIAAATEVSNVARTEAELATLANQLNVAENLLFGVDSDQMDVLYAEGVKSSVMVLGNYSPLDRFVIGSTKAVSMDQLTSLKDSEMMMQLSDQMTYASEIKGLISTLRESGAYEGESFNNFNELLDRYDTCMDKRYQASSILYGTYSACLNKMISFMNSHGVTYIDDSNYYQSLQSIADNNAMISYWEQKAQEYVWVVAESIEFTFKGETYSIPIKWEKFYPYAAQAAAEIARLTEINEQLQNYVDMVEGWNQLLNECNDNIEAARGMVESRFNSAVEAISPYNPGSITMKPTQETA